MGTINRRRPHTAKVYRQKRQATKKQATKRSVSMLPKQIPGVSTTKITRSNVHSNVEISAKKRRLMLKRSRIIKEAAATEGGADNEDDWQDEDAQLVDEADKMDIVLVKKNRKEKKAAVTQ